MTDTPRIVEPATVQLAHEETATTAIPWWRQTNLVLAAVAGLLALAALYAVFVVIPARTASPENSAVALPASPTVSPTQGTEAAEDPESAPAAPFETVRRRADEQFAREVLSDIVERQERLTTRRVDLWNPEDMATAQASAEQGDVVFLSGDYTAARGHYESALKQLDALLEALEVVRTESIEAIDAGLEAGDHGQVQTALQLMESVYPDDPLFPTKRARLEVMAETLELMDEARLALRNGELELSMEGYQSARVLDPERRSIAPAIAEVQSALNERNFRRALGTAFSAIQQGQFDRAESAFNQARRLRPEAPEIAEGMRQLDDQRTLARINALQAAADAHSRNGRWAEAEKAYQEALSIDGSLAFAREGLRFTGARAAMEEQLQRFLQDPPMLSNDQQLADAVSAYQQAIGMASPGERILRLTDELEAVLEHATQIVPVVIESDGTTEITIAQVARLGRLQRQQIDLRPGRYVLLGQRLGFRDVRAEVIVGPNQRNFTVRCTEPI